MKRLKEESGEGSSFLVREDNVIILYRAEVQERRDYCEQKWKKKIRGKGKDYKD